MMAIIKRLAKRALVSIGLMHPSMGIKISGEEKAQMILKHRKGWHKVFIETGTSKGWMVERMVNEFDEIYSIELDKNLFDKSKDKFQNNAKIKIFNGDSGVVLKFILNNLNKPALFWLDAHATGDITIDNSPILKELNSIFRHSIKNHMILIDDARKFDRKSIDAIQGLAQRNGFKSKIKEGLFVVYPI